MCLLEPLRYNPRTMRKFSAPLIFIGIVLLAALAAWQGVLHGGKEAGTISGTVTIDPTLASKVQATDVLFVIVRRPCASNTQNFRCRLK